MGTTLHNEAVIVGIGQTDFTKNSGRSEVQLAAECTKAAIADAGLEASDIDGMTNETAQRPCISADVGSRVSSPCNCPVATGCRFGSG